MNNPDLQGTFPGSTPAVTEGPSQTMAEAFREFPTAVRLVYGELVPIHSVEPTAQEIAFKAVEGLRAEQFKINDIPVPPSDGSHRVAQSRVRPSRRR